MTQTEREVLAANDEFYRAFAARDVEVMDSLWARRVPVACVHPGWKPLHGRERVMSSWSAILGGPAPPAISCPAATAYLLGEVAFVVCTEHIPPASFLAATNVFVREDGKWKLAHHHAGGIAAAAAEEEDSEPPSGTVH
jgi:ketosteroid isomerase-like protein